MSRLREAAIARRAKGADDACAKSKRHCRRAAPVVLTNYRGITHREIEFPDRGVVVVSGANEIGKSSMIEALTC